MIRLNLRDADEVRAGYAAVMANADRVSPPPRIDGVLVQPMVPQGIEIVVGARNDPLFGPLIVVGLGGILVEVLKDTALSPAPVTPFEAEGLLRQLKGVQLLEGFRGMPAVDIKRLAQVISDVSRFAADHRDSVAELDVNPLICAGDRITAVDALIVPGGDRPLLAVRCGGLDPGQPGHTSARQGADFGGNLNQEPERRETDDNEETDDEVELQLRNAKVGTKLRERLRCGGQGLRRRPALSSGTDIERRAS